MIAVDESNFSAKCQKLNELWELAEDLITDLITLVPCEVSTLVDIDGETLQDGTKVNKVWIYLGTVKMHGFWRICCAECDSSELNEELWRPITECRIAIRTEAVSWLPQLLNEIAKARTCMGFSIDEAIDDLQQILSTIETTTKAHFSEI